MSIQSINSSISSVDREIHSLENQIQTINNNITRKEREANSILDKINREKDLKRIITHQKDLTKKNEDINKLTKDKAGKIKTLSDKQIKRTKLIQELSKEEQKEMLSLQQSITREMERQRTISADSFQTTHFQTESILPDKKYDVFVSHASEDKENFVRPFVEALQAQNIAVWYDEFELRLGDSLRRSIDNGLRNSTYGIVVLSESFFNKEWPQRELDGLFAREVNGAKVILPLWHKISKNEVMNYSPLIADMLAINTTDYTIEEIADKIAQRIKI